MLRAYLLVYPFLCLYVLLGTVFFVPLTWITRDIRAIYWVARTGVRLGLRLSGVKVKLVHREYAFEHPSCVYVSNHVSNLEPPALFMVLPRVAFVLKQELTMAQQEAVERIPLLGYVMGLGGFIYVNRKDRNSRRMAQQEAVERLREGISLIIFPEGTRSRDGQLLPFRPGPFTIAIEAQAPIVPVTVHGAHQLMPKGQSTVAPGEISLVFHPPVLTEGLGPEGRGELMKRIRQTMEEAL